MKKALIKDSFKEIKNTYKRFISILLMAFLGVGFFAGIRAASPDMVNTIDKYYDKQKVYDIQLISTLGLTKQDKESIEKIENVENVIGTYETEGKIEIENKEIIAKVLCIEDINKPILIEGDFPNKEDECAVEKSFLDANGMKIGDKIDVEIENVTNSDNEEVPYLKQKQMKIVGTIKSPMYISRDRGSSSLGAGKINYYLYISKENISEKDVYTNIYLTINGAEDKITSSKEYENLVDDVKQKIEDIKEERQNARKEELVNTANQKVNDAEEELTKQTQDANKKIEDAQKELNNAKSQINSAEQTLAKNEKKANTEFEKAENQINSAKQEIEKNKQELLKKESEANSTFENLEKQKEDLQKNLTQVENNILNVQKSYDKITEELKDTNLKEDEKQALKEKQKTLNTQLQTLNVTKQQLQAGITTIQTNITNAKNEIENGKKQIETASKELTKQEETYKQNKENTQTKFKNASNDIESSKITLKEGEQELADKKKELEEEIHKAQVELADAKQEINKIENPKWYILDRYSNAGYSSFIQDTKSIENIGKLFPVVFFIVATLISLTSMTRMVEEQRTFMGTLKALGYSAIQIMKKYVLYASLACVIGGILGMCVGFVLLPKIIWRMYQMMYQLEDDIAISFNLQYGGLGLLLISIGIIGATIYSVIKELRQTPATLIRPKAPKKGKRVLLEKIPFIWKRLNFTQKVTIRNIFRYKKRFLMTIIGILGCTSLILCGFGIKDSIKSIMPNQFQNIFCYDMQIGLKSGLEENEKQNFINNLTNREEIKNIAEVYITSSKIIKNENEEEVQIIVPNDESTLKEMIKLKDIKTKEEVSLKENEICLTDKAAQLLGVKESDTIVLKNSENEEVEVKISNIVENYISHYVYMSKQTYENLYNKIYDTNVIYTKNIDLTDEQEENLSADIMNQNGVATISTTSSAMSLLDDTMKSLDYVVVILIVSAGLLAFVVLYNLSNVNISERIRELATIKVLGFYDKEVYNYVSRETVILTIIGILLGLIGGYLLNYIIIGTCEINILRFSKIIKPISYVYAVLITIVFTLIVNVVTYFALKKINMIESLKSIE